jgi:acyl carrier protein
MRAMSSFDYIKQLLVDKYEVKSEAIKPESTLQDLGIDSLTVVEMIFDVSEKYGIDIPDERLKFTTLGEVVAIVDEFVAAKAG